jgi:hypothetical protein
MMGGRRFRIREFEDSQIEFMRLKWFVLGAAIGIVPFLVCFAHTN